MGVLALLFASLSKGVNLFVPQFLLPLCLLGLWLGFNEMTCDECVALSTQTLVSYPVSMSVVTKLLIPGTY